MRALPLLILLSIFLTAPCAVADAASALPFKRMLDDPTSFSGVKDASEARADAIAIGFLLPESHDLAEVILKAATTTVTQANAEGGYRGIPFSITHRTASSPWQTGSKELIKLVYRDKPVLIFTLFSAETHMAAQIAAKAYIPVISLSSGDSTLTQARLPWIIRMTPDYKTQAATLLRHCTERNINRIGIISTIRQDSRIAAKDIVDTLTEHGMQPLFHHQLASTKNNWVEAVRQTSAENPGALFVAAGHHEIIQIISLLNKHNIRCPLYFCWTPGLNWQTAAKEYKGRILSASPIPTSPGLHADGNNTDTRDPALSALVSDGVQMAIAAIQKSGPARTAIRESLSSITTYPGKNTIYIFNNGGGNIHPPYIIQHSQQPF